MITPLVSVVLPTFNRASHLRRSVGSVLAQSFADFELLVVDDGSTDDTQAVLATFGDARIRYLRREHNGGAAAARNTGVRAATGQYLAFQDSDDEWLLDKLRVQLADLQPLDGRSMSICGVLRLVGARALLTYPRQAAEWDGGLDRRGVLRAAVAYTQSWLVPRQAVLEAGLFDERLAVWDDWDLLIRLAARLDLRTRREPLVVSMRSADSLSQDAARFARDLPELLARYASDLQHDPATHAALHQLLASWLLRSGRPEAARAALRTALRLQPLRPAAWRLWARTLLPTRA